MASDVRDYYRKAIIDFFRIMQSEDLGPDFNAFFREAEKSMCLLVSSAPDVNILNEILYDAYSLVEKMALVKPSIEKKLKHVKDSYEELITRAVNKSLIQSEEKRLNITTPTEDLICPECSKPVSRDSEFCPYCGTELINCVVCKSVIGGNQELIICSRCGESAHLNCLAKNDRKCPKCGETLS